MAQLVKKWVAGDHYNGEILIEEVTVRVTAKQMSLVREDGPAYSRASIAVGYRTQFSLNNSVFFDTRAEAIAALRARLANQVMHARRKLESAQRLLDRAGAL